MGFPAIAAGIAGLLLLLTLASRKTTPKTRLVNMGYRVELRAKRKGRTGG